jgi:hypothetical protein
MPLPTGRTWRDLPPAPPVAAPTPPVVPEAASPVAVAAPRRWPWAVGALGVVLAGVLVGMVAFRGGSAGLALQAAPPTTVAPPSDPIVPAPPPELGGPPSSSTDPLDGLAEELGRLFEGPLLDELLRGLTEREPDTQEVQPEGGETPPGESVRSIEAIVIVPVPPPDHRISANTLYLERAGVRQELVLTGPVGEIVVAGERGSAASTPIGERVAVRGTMGDLVEAGGRLVLAWQESESVAVRIDAPAAFGREALIALAESLEVAP